MSMCSYYVIFGGLLALVEWERRQCEVRVNDNLNFSSRAIAMDIGLRI